MGVIACLATLCKALLLLLVVLRKGETTTPLQYVGVAEGACLAIHLGLNQLLVTAALLEMAQDTLAASYASGLVLTRAMRREPVSNGHQR